MLLAYQPFGITHAPFDDVWEDSCAAEIAGQLIKELTLPPRDKETNFSRKPVERFLFIFFLRFPPNLTSESWRRWFANPSSNFCSAPYLDSSFLVSSPENNKK